MKQLITSVNILKYLINGDMIILIKYQSIRVRLCRYNTYVFAFDLVLRNERSITHHYYRKDVYR